MINNYLSLNLCLLANHEKYNRKNGRNWPSISLTSTSGCRTITMELEAQSPERNMSQTQPHSMRTARKEQKSPQQSRCPTRRQEQQRPEIRRNSKRLHSRYYETTSYRDATCNIEPMSTRTRTRNMDFE